MEKIKYRNISAELSNLTKPALTSNRHSLGFDEKIKEFYFIPVDDLLPFRNQARKHFNLQEIKNLANSIKKHGVRNPLTVMASSKGKFEVISGERRLRASKLIKLDKVPCIILKNKEIAQEIAIIENIHREDLHPVELGKALKILMTQKILKTQVEISEKLALSESAVSEYIKYANIPEGIQEYLIKNNVKSREILRKVLNAGKSLDNIKELLGIVKKGKKINFSVMRINLLDNKLQFQLNGVNGTLNFQMRHK